MIDKIKSSIDIQMIVGVSGLLFLTVGFFKYLTIVIDPLGYAFFSIGFAFVVHYIYTLEKKTGMSSTFQWIRTGVILIILVVIYNVLK